MEVIMASKIVDDVGEYIGYQQDTIDAYKPDLMMVSNGALLMLSQILGTKVIGRINTGDETWDSVLDGVDSLLIPDCKLYICARARAMFDPPQNSVVSQSLNSLIDEVGYRLSISSGGDDG